MPCSCAIAKPSGNSVAGRAGVEAGGGAAFVNTVLGSDAAGIAEKKYGVIRSETPRSSGADRIGYVPVHAEFAGGVEVCVAAPNNFVAADTAGCSAALPLIARSTARRTN